MWMPNQSRIINMSGKIPKDFIYLTRKSTAPSEKHKAGMTDMSGIWFGKDAGSKQWDSV